MKVQKKSEEKGLKVERFRLHVKIVIFNSLIAKYSRIAKGIKGKGRYKASEASYQLYFGVE